MKIGIITYPFNANFGGLLQNYALQQVLKERGHDVYTLCTTKLIPDEGVRRFFAIGYRFVKKYIFGNKRIAVFSERILNKENVIISEKTDSFKKKYITIYEVENIEKCIKENDFNALIVGSDQVWRVRDNLSVYYLGFARKWNVRKIAYAASFGTDDWEYSTWQTKKSREQVKHFDCVSVREESAIGICKKHLNIDAMWVLDPTLLLEKEKYESLLSQEEKIKGKYVFNYILDRKPEKTQVLNKICSLRQCGTISTNAEVANRKLPVKERVQPRVEDWLMAIKCSDFVFTDSFHGMVFAIIFEKPFVVFGNKSRGLARFASLLKRLKLEDRLIGPDDVVTQEMTDKDIDYKRIKEILVEFREESLSFLDIALK